MDIKRVLLYGALTLIGYFLWMHWQLDYPQVPALTQISAPTAMPDSRTVPVVTAAGDAATSPAGVMPVATADESARRIYVTTDVLSLAIDLKHGDIVNAQLLAYPDSADPQSKPFTLLQDNPALQYVAQSSLVVVKNQQVTTLDVPFTTASQTYALKAGERDLKVVLTGEAPNGLLVTKEFVFKRGTYVIDVNYLLNNHGAASWSGYVSTQLLRSSPKEDKTSALHMGSFTGASYSVPGVHRYRKLSFKDMAKTNLDVETEGGWVAMQQHYFLSAWVPAANSKHRLYSRVQGQDYTIGQVSSPLVVAPQEQQTVVNRLYLGPETTENLKALAPGLDLTVDYGWLWFISQLLFSLMKTIYSFVGNWGWAIVLVTLLIKIAFYRLQASSVRSMANMRTLQPKIQALRERYGDDKAKISQATMELYRQEKVNPLGGCLPILIQIPVFYALYCVLIESVELRQAPFIFWIRDLASADPYHVLPVLMGITMLIQQKLSPAPPDPMQAKIMMFLPVVMTIAFLNFPAGLVLYWAVNNTLAILQQWYITRKLAAVPAKQIA